MGERNSYSMDWTKRKGTTSKRTMNPALYDELSFSWRKDIDNLILQHNFPEEFTLNLDQTPMGFTSVSKVPFASMGSKKVPISNINGKPQITGTFTVIYCQSN